MLTIQSLREERTRVLEALAKRNIDATQSVDQILQWDAERRATQGALDDALARANALAKEVGNLMRQGDTAAAEGLRNEAAGLREQTGVLREQMGALEAQIQEALCQIPNAPSERVVAGRSADDNVEVFRSGALPELPEGALPHWDLAARHDLIDFDLGAKVTGAGFPFYKGKGARLQRGLIRFFLEQAEAAGYTEYIPPLLVNADSGFGTGQLPDKEGQMYHTPADDLYLIPTAEVPLTNIYRDALLREQELPIRLCGYTPCFRREAGSYGKDVRGLNRLHQFDKVEIVQFAHPSQSYALLEEMVVHVQGLLQALELPYRILRLCGGDMGFASAMTYDFEVWSAAQGRWLEVSSVSNFETFQANRLKCRFKGADGKTQLVHTLNGSALALPRIVAALLENHQQRDGSVRIPEGVRAWVGLDQIG